MGPLDAPAGTSTTSVVVVTEIMVSFTPFSEALFSDSTGLKFIPVMLTVVEMFDGPLAGEKLSMIGSGLTSTKFISDTPDLPLTVTVISPVRTLEGTITESCVEVADTTVSETPLMETRLSALVVLKFVPVMVMLVSSPSTPEPGEKPVIVGTVLMMVKSSADNAVLFLTVTWILPVVVP